MIYRMYPLVDNESQDVTHFFAALVKKSDWEQSVRAHKQELEDFHVWLRTALATTSSSFCFGTGFRTLRTNKTSV